ncbi:hypothetical protein LG634_32615 [Streptomyces bambusae]|uniref:hypothetical protein n=1 Tax=Streptomyces bambusae TaxID=1550616 RepID=UPI001CFF7056|nr:hypothetical protein [Streptomyces bambusae]MCB5169537.1 hypothetical protein [Streptomyces bambusae]
MAETFPVRCPACGLQNAYVPPAFPCACGRPVTPPLDPGTDPVALTHRTWSESWVAVRCTACGRRDEWPQPEVGCSCGTVARVPVQPADTGVRTTPGSVAEPPTAPPPPAAPPAPRAAFRPLTIRTAGDAVLTAALYLRWLGFRDVRQPEVRPLPTAAVDLRAPGLVAQVDPTTAPAGLRAVECLWLNGLTESATAAYFALAGYTDDARGRAGELGVPLFAVDLTGVPQPVNDPAEHLVRTGALG